jgi:ribonuclease HI
MELKAVIECIKFIQQNTKKVTKINVFTDSSYVKNLIHRREKLEKAGFKTKKGKDIANREWVEAFYTLLDFQPVEIKKVDSHQKRGVSEETDYNRQVDQLARKLLKKEIKGLNRG